MLMLWILQMKRNLLYKFKKVLYICICIVCVLLMVYYYWPFKSNHLFNHMYFKYDLASEEPVDPDQTCILPRIHPFDKSVLPYLSNTRPIKCRQGLGSLTFVDQMGFLRYNHTALSNAGFSTIHCSYQNILRMIGNDDKVVYGDKQVLPSNGIFLENDFVYVSCTNFAGVVIYSTIHLHVRNLTKTKPSSTDKSVNVVIFGLDSMSRLSFIRLLPQTYHYLTEVMKSKVFRGMNKVGDNTFPNLIAMLTGKEAYGGELPSEFQFDEWPCIWKNYSDYNYTTLFAEDFPRFGLFNYLAPGFKHSPTDYYLRPFWLAAEHSTIHHLSSHLCFGPTPKHILQMNYLKDFLIKYNKTRYFAFSFLAEVSHEYLSQVASADEDFVTFLRTLYEDGLLNRTMFIFMSDHGHRFDAIRKTAVGRVEERMPFFSIFLPQILVAEQPHIVERLQQNSARLITHYDTYCTLMDILSYSVNRTSLGHTRSKFGISLFSIIPLNRTCLEAGIPDHYCTCGKEIPLSTDLPKVKEVANVIISQINKLLSEELKTNSNLCAHLSISQIKSASQLIYHSSVSSTDSSSILSIVLEAEPSKGLFESTVRLSGDSSYEILGDISRINQYSNQSSCIQHNILRKYCYCIV